MAVQTPTGRDFNAVFEAGIGPSGAMRNGGVSDRLRDRLVREEHQRLARQGWETATVISLHSFPLSLNLGELGMLEVPAAEPGGFARLELRHYRISMRDLGDGNFTPVSVLPRELAKEVQREYGAIGGVFWYDGLRDPGEEELAAARASQRAWWRQEFEKAVDAWQRYRQHKMITDRQREAARQLYSAGEIGDLPEWASLTRMPTDRRDCPMCGESIKVSAKICHFCRTKLSAPEPGV